MDIEDLKKQRRWVCFKLTQKENHLDKDPISAYGTETGSDDAHAHTWVTYNEAVKTTQEKHYDAVGFSVPKGMGFVDMDGVEPTAPPAKMRIERLNTYTERSISGTGIHAYGIVDISRIPTYVDKDGRTKLDRQFYQKNPHNGMEIYFGDLTNRFAVFTGNVINNAPLRDCTEAFLTTLDKDMRRKPKKKYSKKRDGDSDADKELFNLICNLRRQKNGEKFRKLYDEGDFSDYGSQSEADLALCAMIAFRTGNDPEMIDKAFRASALMREKWNRDDYREATIEKGIEACDGTFHQTKMPHPYFIRFNEETGQPYIVVPLLAKYTRENLDYILVRDNGKQGLLKYVYKDGVYQLYSSDMMMGVIKQYIADYDEELVNMSKVSQALQHITTDLNYVGQDELNAEENMINFQNGLLHVTDTGLTLTPHTPDVYSTIQIPCSWTERPSPTPVFDSYMETLTNADKEVYRLLLEFIGACISNIKGWRLKKSLFLVGDGDTGKSQLKSLVERLLGKGNFVGIDLKEIEARFGTGVIYGTRLAGSSDMSFLSVDELKTFKNLTGGDSVFAELKGMQGFEYTYSGLLWFCMNRLPKFGGDNGKWVYDRIMVVKCPNVISKDRQDKNLIDKMYAERDGIIYKAVRALQTVIRNGYRFSEPESVAKARETYQSENSTIITFFEECMCPWPDGKVNHHCTTGRVYRVYQGWCRENNNGFSRTAKEFREELAAHLGGTYQEITVRQKGNTYYRDYGLSDETKELFVKEYGYDCNEFL
jgi:putative DNA primase/helicase